VSYQVNWEIQALDQTAGFLRDDPIGVAALWDTVSQLADEPRPPRRSRSLTGRRICGACGPGYRVFYAIDAPDVRGPRTATGHFVPEEAPDLVFYAPRDFLD